MTDSSRVTVEAASAAAAAEKVSSSRLVGGGPPALLRARVWQIGEDFGAVCTEFYLPASTSTPAKGFSRNQWIIFVLICVVFALANAVILYLGTGTE